MKSLKFIVFVFTALSTSVVVSGSLAAQELLNYIGRYRSESVNAVVAHDRGSEAVTLLRLEGDDIVYRPQRQQVGEAVRAISEIKNLHFQQPSNYASAVQNIRDTLYKEGIDKMRPFVYSILTYQDIPSNNFFPLINYYFQALVNAKENNEAIYLVRNLKDLNRATPEFMDNILSFSRVLVEGGKQVDAATILNRIPFNQENPDLLQTISNYADDLRRKERYTEANFLYNRLIEAGESPFRLRSILWHIYGDATAQRTAIADVFLTRYLPEAPPTDDPFFSLYQLIQARIHLLHDRQEQAIREVTRGVVFAMLDSEWTSELFYLNGQSYERLENLPTAAEIYNTIKIFYPNSRWAIRSQARLDEITPKIEAEKRKREAEATSEQPKTETNS